MGNPPCYVPAVNSAGVHDGYKSIESTFKGLGYCIRWKKIMTISIIILNKIVDKNDTSVHVYTFIINNKIIIYNFARVFIIIH